MLCKSFEELSHREKVEFIGKLCHACQTSEKLFFLGTVIIYTAEDDGLFDNVKILLDGEEKDAQPATDFGPL